MNTPTMLTVEIGFRSYFNRHFSLHRSVAWLDFRGIKDRRRLEFPDDVVEYLDLLHVDAVDHLPMMDDNLINEVAYNVFGQFFRIDGTVNNIEENLCGVNLFDIAFYLFRQCRHPLFVFRLFFFIPLRHFYKTLFGNGSLDSVLVHRREQTIDFFVPFQ